jgi:flagellar assembly factor FliW
MQITTTRFGEVDVKDESVLHFEEGMYGFEDCTRFVLLEDRPDNLIKWMQAVDNPAVAFMIVNPNDFFPDYEVELTDEQATSLGLTDPSESAMFTTITISRDEGKVTTNLVGPIVMNFKTMQAKQIILSDDRYCTKHVIGERKAEKAKTELTKAA